VSQAEAATLPDDFTVTTPTSEEWGEGVEPHDHFNRVPDVKPAQEGEGLYIRDGNGGGIFAFNPQQINTMTC